MLLALVPTIFIAWLAAFVAGRLARRALADARRRSPVAVESARPRSAAARQPHDVRAVHGADPLPGVRAGRRETAHGRAAQDDRRVGVRTRPQDPADRRVRLRADPHDDPPGAPLRARGQPGDDPRRARARQARAHARVARQQRLDHRHQRRRRADGPRTSSASTSRPFSRAPASPAWRSASARRRSSATSSAGSS